MSTYRLINIEKEMIKPGSLIGSGAILRDNILIESVVELQSPHENPKVRDC